MTKSNITNLEKVDKTTLKAAIKEILLEDKTILKEVFQEIFAEQSKRKEEGRSKEIESQIDEIFDGYDEVFKALA